MKYNLSEISSYITDKILISELQEYQYISTDNMVLNRGGIVPTKCFPSLGKVVSFKKGDILISNIRPYFKKIWFARFNGGCSNDVLVVRAKSEIDNKFLYYALSSDEFFDYVTATSKDGTKMPRGDKVAVMKYQLPKFSLETQQKIVKILSALDEKIELNNKINENLHAQAQAIFKSWFVDFEPFGGTIPSDWEETDIYHFANIIYGAPFSSKLFNSEKKGRPLLRIRDLKNQEASIYTEQVLPKEYLLQQGDIVVGMDGEFKPYLWAGEEVLLNQRVCVFQNKRELGKVFLYFSLVPLLAFIEQTEIATTVIHIGKSDFDSFKLLLPSAEILNEFDKLTTPYFKLIIKNVRENKRLAQIRDTLLPKLMSGELEV